MFFNANKIAELGHLLARFPIVEILALAIVDYFELITNVFAIDCDPDLLSLVLFLPLSLLPVLIVVEEDDIRRLDLIFGIFFSIRQFPTACPALGEVGLGLTFRGDKLIGY